MRRPFIIRAVGIVGLGIVCMVGQPVFAQKPLPFKLPSLLRTKSVQTIALSDQLKKKIVRGSAELWTGKGLVDGVNPLRGGVFCARAEKGMEAFSGGIFETVYNGQKEIYGFIVTHALTDSPASTEYSLHRFFTLEVTDKQGVWHRIPAEVVQVSPVNTLDVSLVRFLPEHEPLLTPLVISNTMPQVGETVQSQGFCQHTEGYLPHRRVLENAPFSLRATLAWPHFRNGFCGGAVVNTNHELVGVHTGSVPGPTEQEDIGYATHAYFLNILVDAYHNGGEAFIPLILNGHKIVDLAVDEGIEWVNYYDEWGRKIYGHLFNFKFSFVAVERMIREYTPRYMELSIGRLQWSKENPDILERVPHVRRVIYDLKEERIIPEIPSAN